MKIKKTLFLRVCIIVLFFVFFGGCTKPEINEPEKPRTIKIGVIYPFSGSLAASGNDLKDGLELALDIVKNSYDLPLPLAKEQGLTNQNNPTIELIYRDYKNDAEKAAQFVEELVKNENVVAIIGCYSSTITAAASERAEMLHIPFINTASTSPLLTQRNYKWFFRTTPDDKMFAQNFFTFLSQLPEHSDYDIPKKVTLVYEQGLWGTGVAQAEKKLVKRYDYEILQDIPYNPKNKDLKGVINKINDEPGIIMQASYATDAIKIVQGYKMNNKRPVAILGMNAGFISPGFISTLGSDAENILSRDVWALDLGKNKPVVTQVNALFKDKYGRDMTGNSARAFTGALVLFNALNNAKTMKAEDVREALLKTDLSSDQIIMPWNGVLFDPTNGQNTKGKGIIAQVQNGVYVTVWPWKMASAKINWPLHL